MISEVDIKDMKPETIRGEILNEANRIVNGARADVYGGPEDSFRTISRLWATYLSRAGSVVALSASDVAAMMALLKIARLQNSPEHRDSWVDIAGYAACGAETAGVKRDNPVAESKVPTSKPVDARQVLSGSYTTDRFGYRVYD